MNPGAIFHWGIAAIVAAITTGLAIVSMTHEDRLIRPARTFATPAVIFVGTVAAFAVCQYFSGLWPGECSISTHVTTSRETSSGRSIQELLSRPEAHR